MPGASGPTLVILGARGFIGSRAAESARRLPGWTVRVAYRCTAVKAQGRAALMRFTDDVASGEAAAR
ncbi:hypothetical protein GCM10009857_14490 [Agromyces soli]